MRRLSPTLRHTQSSRPWTVYLHPPPVRLRPRTSPATPTTHTSSPSSTTWVTSSRRNPHLYTLSQHIATSARLLLTLILISPPPSACLALILRSCPLHPIIEGTRSPARKGISASSLRTHLPRTVMMLAHLEGITLGNALRNHQEIRMGKWCASTPSATVRLSTANASGGKFTVSTLSYIFTDLATASTWTSMIALTSAM